MRDRRSVRPEVAWDHNGKADATGACPLPSSAAWQRVLRLCPHPAAGWEMIKVRLDKCQSGLSGEYIAGWNGNGNIND